MDHGLLQQCSSKSIRSMQNNAGFFPCDQENFERFYDLMWKSCGQVDILGVWYNKMEDFFIQCAMDSPELVRLRALEPYYTKNHWTSALKGKKVLVIHPFADSIACQYQKRRQLFEEEDMLPEFQLLTMKAVVTHAGQTDDRFGSWFDALNYMIQEAMNYDFDCAIIGCGAYGFPLAAALKQRGKQVVHMGGATQLLFGIKGKRWDNHQQISRLYNEAWIRPSEEETPKNPKGVENGCYW